MPQQSNPAFTSQDEQDLLDVANQISPSTAVAAKPQNATSSDMQEALDIIDKVAAEAAVPAIPNPVGLLDVGVQQREQQRLQDAQTAATTPQAGQLPGAATDITAKAKVPNFLTGIPSETLDKIPGFGNLRRGIERALLGTAPTVEEILAVSNSSIGLKSAAQRLFTTAQRQRKTIDDLLPPEVQFKDAFNSLPNFVKFAAEQLGEQSGFIATTIASGGLGGIIGRLVGEGVVAGTDAATAAAKLSMAVNAGREIGAGLGATAIETGATGSEIFQSTGQLRPGLAITGGLAKGILETAVPLAFTRSLGITQKLAGGLLTDVVTRLRAINNPLLRFGSLALGAGVAEGATESAQEAVDIAIRGFVDKNFDVLGPKARERLLQSGTVGAVIGALLGGFGGSVRRGEPTPRAGKLPIRPTRPVVDPGAIPPELVAPERATGAATKATPAPKAVVKKARVVKQFGLQPDGAISPEAANVLKQIGGQVRAKQGVRSALDNFKKTLSESKKTVSTVDTAFGIIKSLTIPNSQGTLKGDIAKFNISEIVKKLADSTVIRNELKATLRAEAKARGTTLQVVRATVQKKATALDAVLAKIPTVNKAQALAIEGLRALVTNKLAIAKRKFTQLQTLAKRKDFSQIIHQVELTKNGNVIDARGKVTELKIDQTEVDKVKLKQAIDQANIPTASVRDIAPVLDRIFPTAAATEAEAIKNFDDLVASGLDLTTNENFDRAKLPEIVKDLKELKAQRKLSTLQRLARLGVVFKGQDATLFKTLKTPRLTVEKFRSQLQGNKTESGTAYDETAHREGTVELIADGAKTKTALDQTQRKNLTKSIKMLNGLLKLFRLDSKIVVAIDGSFLLDGRIKTTNLVGASSTFTEQHAILLLSKKVLSDGGLRLATTIAHEFGHILFFQRFFKLTPGEQALAVRAFNASIVKASTGGLETFNAARSNVAVIAKAIEDGLFKNDEAFIDHLTGDPDYWFNFEEFLAEQTARWLTSRKPALTFADKFFKGLASELTKVYAFIRKSIGLKESELQVNEDVGNLIDSLAFGKKLGAPEALRDGFSASLGQSSIDNSKVFETNSFPSSGLGEGVGNILDKAFADTKPGDPQFMALKDRAEIKAGVDHIGWGLKFALAIQQLAKVNKGIRQLQRYKEFVDLFKITSTKWKSRADERLKPWKSLGSERILRLQQFMFAMDQQEYNPNPAQSRQPSRAELIALTQKYQIDDEMFGLFKDVRQDLLDFITEIEQANIASVQRNVADDVARQDAIQEIQQQYERLRAKPYFPHSRFGDFAVIVKDKAGKTVHAEQFATEKKALRGRVGLEKIFPESEGFVSRADKMPETVKTMRGLPAPMLQLLRNLPGLTIEQSAWIDNFIVEAAPGQSFRKRLARRENIPGFDLDAIRSYANYFWHGSNYLARITYKDQMEEQIASINEEATSKEFVQSRSDRSVVSRREIATFMHDHLENILNPKADWAQLRSIAFIWYLGFTPASAIVNLTQTPMVTFPYLAARYGDVAAVRELIKATKSLPRIMRMKTDDISDGFLKALTRGIENGVLDESFAKELAAVGGGGNLTRLLPGSKAERFLINMSHYSAFLFQTAEKMNRHIAFRAAWQLANRNIEAPIIQEIVDQNQLLFGILLKEGFTREEARGYLAARDAVLTTQFQYSKEAQPRFMRGKRGVLLTFWTFKQNIVFFAAQDRGRIRFMIMAMLLGGLSGIPFEKDIGGLARFLARTFLGKDFDVDRQVRELVMQLAGKSDAARNGADFILHGASRFGFGLPAALDLLGLPSPDFDISGSLSGQILPGTDIIGRPGLSDAEVFSRVATDAAGATFGIGINAIRAITDSKLAATDFKRWERAMPRALRSTVKAFRLGSEGRERTRSGATLQNFDIADPQQLAELAFIAGGFGNLELNRKWDRIRMQQEAIAFWQTRRGILFAQLDKAVQSKDKQVLNTMLGKIREFNKELGRGELRGFSISRKDIRNSLRSRSRRRALFEAGIDNSRRARPLAGKIGELFPAGARSAGQSGGTGAAPETGIEQPQQGTIINVEKIR